MFATTRPPVVVLQAHHLHHAVRGVIGLVLIAVIVVLIVALVRARRDRRPLNDDWTPPAQPPTGHDA
ncbi:MAG: hypothetical protein ACRDV0_00240 [Acidimicrobiales bacterium]